MFVHHQCKHTSIIIWTFCVFCITDLIHFPFLSTLQILSIILLDFLVSHRQIPFHPQIPLVFISPSLKINPWYNFFSSGTVPSFFSHRKYLNMHKCSVSSFQSQTPLTFVFPKWFFYSTWSDLSSPIIIPYYQGQLHGCTNCAGILCLWEPGA